MSLRLAFTALTLVLIACSSGSSGASNECEDREGTYEGRYSADSSDCPAGTDYEPTSVSIRVTITNGRFYLSAAGQSCSGALDACGASTLAGVCDGTTMIGSKAYPNVSRVAFGAGGSLAVTHVNVTPQNSKKQCVLDVSFIGEKTSD